MSDTLTLRPGTAVYDVHGSPDNPEDTGIIHSVQEGGYAVMWTGVGATPKYAAADEVALIPVVEPEHRFRTITERVKKGHLTAWVAIDNVEVLAQHVAGIVAGTDRKRRMTIISRYRHHNQTATREDRGLVGTTIQTGLTLDNRYTPDGEAIEHRTRTNPVGHHLTVHLQPGINTFGFGAFEDDGTEEEKRARYWAYDPADVFSDRRNITKIRVDGWPGNPRTDDRITIERWNEHGVCEDIIIVFDDVFDGVYDDDNEDD